MQNIYHKIRGGTGFLISAKIYLFQILFIACTSIPLAAQNYVVNNNGDTHAASPGAGTGQDGSGNITLRSAIEDATARPPGNHNITFSITGTISLSLGQIVVGPNGFTIETTANNGATQIGTTATIKTTSNHNFLVGQQVAVYGVIAMDIMVCLQLPQYLRQTVLATQRWQGCQLPGKTPGSARASNPWGLNITGPGAVVAPYSAPQITITQTTANRVFFHRKCSY